MPLPLDARPSAGNAPHVTAAKRDKLLSVLQGYGRVAVAFSAGVDSTLVAKAAQLACGENAVAVTAESASVADGEVQQARELAAQIGIRHQVIATGEFQSDAYRRNDINRCYFCKTELYTQLIDHIAELNVDVIVNGANLDDCGDHRPGMRAANEHSVRSPLIESEFTKADVRALAKEWNLTVWDKPASPCLSSRVAYGVTVTPERVARIDAAEKFLRETFAIRELRVRCEHDDLARIEVPTAHIATLLTHDNRASIDKQLRSLGFRCVTIDLAGFRSGSMNDVIPLEQHYRNPAK